MSEFFSERLFAARRACGKKSKQVADECGISAAYYSQIESSKRGVPPVALVNKLAIACCTTVEELLSNSPVIPGSLRIASKSGATYETHVKEAAIQTPLTNEKPCSRCAEKDKEIIFLRELLVRNQENFAAAMAAIERKEHRS